MLWIPLDPFPGPTHRIAPKPMLGEPGLRVLAFAIVRDRPAESPAGFLLSPQIPSIHARDSRMQAVCNPWVRFLSCPL